MNWVGTRGAGEVALGGGFWLDLKNENMNKGVLSVGFL
jgi:hypothetical protein